MHDTLGYIASIIVVERRSLKRYLMINRLIIVVEA